LRRSDAALMISEERFMRHGVGWGVLRGGARYRPDARTRQQSPTAGQQAASGKTRAASLAEWASHRASTNVFASSST
jgi:hypothetical protein